MFRAWNAVTHPDEASREAYANNHASLRIKAYEDANNRLPHILGRIHPTWENKAIFCGPIDDDALKAWSEWKPEETLPARFLDQQDATFRRFDWYHSMNTYENIDSRFEVAVYAGDKLAALSLGGWRNWHDSSNGKDVETNVVCIDTVEVSSQRSLIMPGLSLVAVAEAARSYAQLTNRDMFALNGPSHRMQTILDAVGFPRVEGLDLYMMPVEDLDNVWENLSAYLQDRRQALPFQRTLTGQDIAGYLELTSS
jgi:hypothetical protein